MAKRYHGSQGAYSGAENRREIESKDFHMISEDKSAIANLPQNVMIKAYPNPDDYARYDLNDTIMGVDHQMREDSKRKKKGPYPEMY